jgi:flagellar protein FlaG
MRIDFSSAAPAEPTRAPASPAPADPGAEPMVPASPATRAADSRAIDEAVKSANAAVRQMNTSLTFQTDDSSGRLVVRVIDSETQKVLRQMPSEEMLSLSKAIDRMRGLMIHLKV